MYDRYNMYLALDIVLTKTYIVSIKSRYILHAYCIRHIITFDNILMLLTNS